MFWLTLHMYAQSTILAPVADDASSDVSNAAVVHVLEPTSLGLDLHDSAALCGEHGQTSNSPPASPVMELELPTVTEHSARTHSAHSRINSQAVDPAG